MGQQPNIELAAEDRPRSVPEAGPAVRWRSSKPGIPSGPGEMPGFSRTGPDPGWGLKLVAETQLPEANPKLQAVVTGLVLARAAAMGRAAIPEDIEVALVLCGYGEDASPDLVQRRKRWLAAAPHEQRPGELACAEVETHMLIQKPEQIRYAHRLSEKSQ